MAATPPEAVTRSLQEALVDLVDLSLLGKQAHWNIHGTHFRSVHLQLDDVIDQVRLASDDIAERLATIGGTPDGRASTVAATSQVEGLPGGKLAVDKVIRQFEERLQGAADRIRANLPAVESEDPLSHDMLVAAATDLEKQAWMFRASHDEA
ncbi:Dps family protein [Georgenia faecalis]|uniref:Dps family protein n=1 Tax=Georgenia faecalis TaxID=2483799 RepID=A0ABV9D9Y6_9MICO|nr:DNA starvation/stationary phase protection protein [Georgenia faecalis]